MDPVKFSEVRYVLAVQALSDAYGAMGDWLKSSMLNYPKCAEDEFWASAFSSLSRIVDSYKQTPYIQTISYMSLFYIDMLVDAVQLGEGGIPDHRRVVV